MMLFVLEHLERRALLAATYYVSATGNDSADGRSAAHAWKTLARVNQKDFSPGDRVLFQGGKTFSSIGATSANLLTNGGFESGLGGWSDARGTRAANATITKSAGTYHG